MSQEKKGLFKKYIIKLRNAYIEGIKVGLKQKLSNKKQTEIK